MTDEIAPLRVSAFKVVLVIAAVCLVATGVIQCVHGRWLLGVLAAYVGLLVVFFCGLHGLGETNRARGR